MKFNVLVAALAVSLGVTTSFSSADTPTDSDATDSILSIKNYRVCKTIAERPGIWMSFIRLPASSWVQAPAT